MKKRIITILAVALTVTAFAQTDNRVLLTINGEPTTVSEFMYIYQKNQQVGVQQPQTIDEYMELFVNFRLKVHAAEQAGMDTTEAFRKELENYRSQSVPKYMQDPEIENEVILKAYGRMLMDRQVRHIAIKCPPTATPEEQAEAQAKINLALQRVRKGEPFSKVADELSEDPQVTQNHGLIGWVRPFRFVFSFEEAAYNTPVGEVSDIFKTPFGFHILKVEQEIPHVDIRAQHIMKMTPGNDEEIATLAKDAIDSLYQVVRNGADFSLIAATNSDDKASARQGGDLGWFGRGQMVSEFENAAYDLLLGEDSITAPVKSLYGWHIIKLNGSRGTADLADIREDVIKQIRRSDYQQEINRKYVEKLKADYGLTECSEARKPFYELAETIALNDSAFLTATADWDEILFAFDGKYYRQRDFGKYLHQNFFSQTTNVNDLIDEKYNLFVERELRAHENSLLETKHPELANLMKEYHDGILLFEISLREVWDKASQDTEGLTAYFNEHKKDYIWQEPHYKGFIISAKTPIALKAAKQICKSAQADSVMAYINNRVNIDSIPSVRVEKGLWVKGQKPAVDAFIFKQKGAFTPSEDFPYVALVGKKLKAAETYQDERGKVTSAYQDYLEQAWVRTLRAKYEVVIDEEVLKTLK